MTDFSPPDKGFFDRADAHIAMSNDQCKDAEKGRVSASMMFASARFNAWLSATGWQNGEDMKASRDETIDFFVNNYRKMLEENMDDYIRNHEQYLKVRK